jgi:hypothetical protein
VALPSSAPARYSISAAARRIASINHNPQLPHYPALRPIIPRFDRVTEAFVRCEGVKSLSYSADGYSPIAGGDSTQVSRTPPNLLLPA